MQVDRKREESLTYKALCIALLDKYYGHQCYGICFAHAELKHHNDDAWSGNYHDLVNMYTREGIEVEYILNCLFTESKVQKTLKAQNMLANSILEFIRKISDWSNLYTTEMYRWNYRCLAAFKADISVLVILFGPS